MIPLCVPNISGNEGPYLQDCVATTFVSSVGPYVDRFESMMREATGAAFAVATASGTTALHAALHAVGVGPGDHVIVPTYTFIASANAVSQCHATPILVDVGADDWCLDPALLQALLATEAERDIAGTLRLKRTGGAIRAILPVFGMGLAPDMARICAIAKDAGLPVIADAAAALGTMVDGRPLAQSGALLTCISFNGNKLTTAGGGGAIVTMDEALGRRLKHLTSTARVTAAYDHDVAGFNYRMTNLQAAVGVAQSERLAEFLHKKRAIADRYATAFADIAPAVLPFAHPKGRDGNHWLSGIFCPTATEADMAAFRAALAAAGVESRAFWKPMHHQAPYAAAPRHLNGVADAIWNRIQPLPCSTHLTGEDQQTVIAAVRGFWGRAG